MTRSRLFFLLVLATTLGGCGSMSDGRPPAIERIPSSEPAMPAAGGRAAPAKPGSQKGGGYYLDDGPGDNPPPDIDAIPDAVPHQEAVRAATSRPYSALGQNYTPMKEYQPYKMRGIASWYGRRYHGQKTSSGEIYDMYGMSGAHTTLPIPSYARVTNPENGRSVIVRINDRGPFHSERLIDLSYAAAYKLRITGKGSGLVEVEALDARNMDAHNFDVAATQPAPATQTPPLAQAAPQPAVQPVPSQQVVPDKASLPNGSFIQVGAFKLKENADQLRDRLQQQKLAQNVDVANWYNDGVYRVRIGPYANRDDAERAAGQIRQTLGISALVVTQ